MSIFLYTENIARIKFIYIMSKSISDIVMSEFMITKLEEIRFEIVIVTNFSAFR